MFSLKELVRTVTFPAGRDTTFAALLSRLSELHIPVEEENKDEGRIVACCLTRLVNVGVWHCWSDKLSFELANVDENRTKVNIYAVPNLFRVKVREGEAVIDLDSVLSQLSA